MDRSELLESMVESLPDGVALLSSADELICWNQAAAELTGYEAIDLLGRVVPEGLEPLLGEAGAAAAEQGAGHKSHLRIRHKLGHELPLVGMHLILRDALGGRIGRVVLFHPARQLDSLPRGEAGDSASIAASQQELEERLDQEYDDFVSGGDRFGVLWIAVDPAAELRKTHGAAACQGMLDKLEHVVAQALRPGEILGRWGTEEFLIIAHERTPEMLSIHARHVAGLARTTDFRWWGDRVPVTVSIGVCQARRGHTESLAALLQEAQKNLQLSRQAGGNAITPSAEGKTCLPL